jgi:DNA polymerase III epsilon subunit-like protein
LKALVKEKVADYLLYAQVVKDGKILAEDRSPAATHLKLQMIEFSEVEREFVRIKKRLPHGGTYLDLMERLPREGVGDDPSSYVRLGSRGPLWRRR